MPGHSGISWSFTVRTPDLVEELVIRVPPLGVRRQANLDVVRFAPVLRLAEAGGVPVPSVRWVSEDERWFGTPYLVVTKVEGAPLPDIFEPGHAYPDRATVDRVFRRAVEALVAIHDLDGSRLLETGWATPLDRASDLAQWLPLLEKSEHPAEIDRTRALGDRLLSTAPPDVPPGVVHGDFYSNNWLLSGDRVTAVLDWENTTLNDPGWDLGWLATLYDPECWGPSRAPSMTWHPGPEELQALYEDAAGRPVAHPSWYHALMCYRLAAITPAKVRLHRSGRRVDPVWEVFAEAVPHLLDKGERLLAGSS
jgi:aminoglycoside phosphotransferase (APT) family kinase protein